MESALDFHTAHALLEWQVELGATEAILDSPVDRYEAPAVREKPKAAEAVAPIKAPKIDPVQVAKAAASQANSLAELKAAMAGFEHCLLKRGARSLVFGDGHKNARIMVIGEAPGREEDNAGRAFVGPAGQLLDNMLAAIGMDRSSEEADKAVYVTNVMPWRPGQNRDPHADDLAMMMPFVEKHIALVNPDVVVLMGNIACQGVLGKRGITRLRGDWTEAFGKPVMPMFHPAELLRSPHMKRDAWADLLEIKARLVSAAQ